MALLYRDPNVQRENSRNLSTIVTSDPLAVIYNEGQWRLNKVSPMYKLDYMPVKLKMYASKVRQAIVSAVQASSARYCVQLEELSNLKYDENDPSGMMLTVKSTSKTSDSKMAYVAIFLAWGQNETIDESVHLPYMLERGEQKIGTAMKATWQTLFDCSIKQFSFTQQQLLHFGFSFVDSGAPRSNDPFTITYKTPQVQKEKLSLTFDAGDISIIWTGMKSQAMNDLELTNLTYHILQNQIFHTLLLDITVFDISAISLPKAEIKCNGIVKMKTPEVVNCVLTILNGICNLKSKVFITDSCYSVS